MKDNLVLNILGRKNSFIEQDYNNCLQNIKKEVKKSRIIILGGSGSIGSAVVELLCKYDPMLLHVIDINENGLVELVRNIRSTIGYTNGEFKTFVMDIGHQDFESFIDQNKDYDIWMNFSALKHVRSEKDPYTLMRLIDANIINTYKTLMLAKKTNVKKYFSVSTDKAANPINLMGASKRVMEMILGEFSNHINTSSARFGNVAFSNGSLLHGMVNRFYNKQPFVAPKDVMRYFLTSTEAAKLSILSTFSGKNGELFIPKIELKKIEKSFPEIAKNFLKYNGYEMYTCTSEDEARNNIEALLKKKKWPCYLFDTDTDGEKLEEIFIGNEEKTIKNKFDSLQIIDIKNLTNLTKIEHFIKSINILRSNKTWSVKEVSSLMKLLIKDFKHHHTGKSLDGKM
ncbi:polysaccharide biosynthesis protein [Alphaproteobacteria bacterium]|nr:polysaccharide biosynthesis protein [Alphaproteobacteria bacterium]